jgi:hypothetical protein
VQTRAIRAATRSQRLHGIDKIVPGEGTHFQFADVTLAEALIAFDAAVREPGGFEIITRDQTRIAFFLGHGGLLGTLQGVLGVKLLRRPATLVTLDIWFEVDPEPPLADVHTVSVTSARTLIEAIYRDSSDQELWQGLDLPMLVA